MSLICHTPGGLIGLRYGLIYPSAVWAPSWKAQLFFPSAAHPGPTQCFAVLEGPTSSIKHNTRSRPRACHVTKASMLAEFFFALAIGSGMSCVP